MACLFKPIMKVQLFSILLVLLMIFGNEVGLSLAKKKKGSSSKKKGVATSKKTVENNDNEESAVVLPSGQSLTFHDSKAASKLTKWANELSKTDGSVTFGQAVSREQYVIQKVNSGAWTLDAYHDYQRLAASTGNVDSARLLLEYGIAPLISEVLAKPHKSPLHHAAATCDLTKLKALLRINNDDNAEDDEGDTSNHIFVDDRMEDGTTALGAASLVGCNEGIRLLVEAGADLEATGSHGATPLMIAAAAGEASSCQVLLELGAEGDAQHKFAGQTALHMAAENDWPDTVKALCRGGSTCRVFSRSSNGTALHTSIDVNSSVATVEALVSPKGCGCDIEAKLNGDTTALYLASDHGHSQQLEVLLQHGASVNYNMPVADWSGGSHLTKRAQGLSSTDEDELLLGDAFIMNSEPANGASPLHAAVERGHADCVSLLIGAGADVNTDSMGGVTPLHSVAMHGVGDTTHIIDMLVSSGADVNKRSLNKEGVTALYCASGNGFMRVAERLIYHGANVNEGQRRSGGTPLIHAVGRSQFEMVELLLKSQADINLRHSEKKFEEEKENNGLLKKSNEKQIGSTQRRLYPSPLEVAASMGNRQMVQLLLDHGADACGDPALIFKTISSGNPHTAELVLKHIMQSSSHQGLCNVKELLTWQEEEVGATALHVAAQSLHSDSLQLLLDIATTLDIRKVDEKSDRQASSSSSSSSSFIHHLLELRTFPSAGASATALFLAVKSAESEAISTTSKEKNSQTTSLTSSVSSSSSSLKAIRMLLDAGADVNTALPHEEGAYTPLLAAVELRNVDVVSLLLEYKADPNLGTNFASVAFRAPLLFAVLYGYHEITTVLLKAGANCQIVLGSKTSPKTLQDIARERRHFDTLQVLMKDTSCSVDLSQIGEL